MSRAPKARAKAVVDGNGANIPQPADGDESAGLYLIVGVQVLRSGFQEIAAASDRTRNRHRWTGREYPGAWENDGEGTRQIDPVTSG